VLINTAPGIALCAEFYFSNQLSWFPRMIIYRSTME
jgi:hypothetical protein